jgi:hypothetical protein
MTATNLIFHPATGGQAFAAALSRRPTLPRCTHVVLDGRATSAPFAAVTTAPEGTPRTTLRWRACVIRRLPSPRPRSGSLGVGVRLPEARIGLAVPGRPIGPWSRRTGAPRRPDQTGPVPPASPSRRHSADQPNERPWKLLLHPLGLLPPGRGCLEGADIGHPVTWPEAVVGTRAQDSRIAPPVSHQLRRSRLGLRALNGARDLDDVVRAPGCWGGTTRRFRWQRGRLEGVGGSPAAPRVPTTTTARTATTNAIPPRPAFPGRLRW